MPRNISGNYTLAPGNPVVTGTVIEAAWANPTLSDIAAALTDSLSRSGSGGMLVPFRNADGAVGTPGMSWSNEPSSGWYRAGLNDFWYSVGNENIFRITKTGIELAPGKVAVNVVAPNRVQDADPAPIPTGHGWFESDTGNFYLRYQNPDATFTYIQLNSGVVGIPNSEKGNPNGVATLDGAGQVPASQLALAVLQVEKGVPNGIPTLDATGKVPLTQLPPIGGGPASFTNLTVTGNTILGDSFADTLTVNAGAWTYGSNWTATRAVGVAAAGTSTILSSIVTATGDVGGTSAVRAHLFQLSLSGPNAFGSSQAVRVAPETSASGSVLQLRGALANPASTGTGGATLIEGFTSTLNLSSSGPVSSYVGFSAAVLNVSGTNVVNSAIGFGTADLAVQGFGTVSNAFAFNAANMTIAPVSTISFRSLQNAGAGAWGFFHNGTANNAFVGNVRIGSVVVPTVALDVTGAANVSGNVGVTGNLTVFGNTTLGDAVGDSLAINAGAWTIGNNFTATRNAGTVGGATQSLQVWNSSATGDPGGSSDVRHWTRTFSNVGANATAALYGEVNTVLHSGTALLGTSRGMFVGHNVTSTGSMQNAHGYTAAWTLTAAGGITTAAGFTALAPTLSSTGAITNLTGFLAQNIGHATLITNAIGYDSNDITAGLGTTISYRSQMASGTGKWAFLGSSSAASAFAGNVRIGSNVPPTVALDVTGAGAFSGNVSVAGTLTVTSISPTDLIVTGNTTLGDAAADTFTINAGVWTFGNNWVANRIAGTVAAGSVEAGNWTYSFTGDPGGTTSGRQLTLNVTHSGGNAVASAFNIVSRITHTGSALAGQLQSYQSSITSSGAGGATSMTGYAMNHTISGAGNVGSITGFLAGSLSLSSTGAVTNSIGFSAQNIGHATLVTNAIGHDVVDLTASLTLTAGYRSQVNSGASKWGFYAVGTANNAFLGNTRIGSVVAPTVALDVTGSTNISANLAVTGIAGIGTATSATTALALPAGTLSVSSMRLPHGSAPTAPVNGDFWTTVSSAFARINGVTIDLGAGGGGGASLTIGTTGIIGGAANRVLFEAAGNVLSEDTALTFDPATDILTSTNYFVSGVGTAAAPSLALRSADMGLYSSVANSFNIAVAGKEQVRISGAAGNVNFIHMFGSLTAQFPMISVRGTDANVGMVIGTQGTGNINFQTGIDTTARTQFRIRGDLAAVNFVDVFGALTTVAPQIRSEGSDTNVGLTITTKGLASMGFYSHSSAWKQLEIQGVLNAVNFMQVIGATTGGAPQLRFMGSDASVQAIYATKGAGLHRWFTHIDTVGVEQVRITPTASAVNYLDLRGAVAADYPRMQPGGTDTNIGLIYDTKGTGSHQFRTGLSGANIQFTVGNTVSAANSWVASGAVTGSSPFMTVAGPDANIGLRFVTKASGDFVVLANAGVTTTFVARTSGATDANYIVASSAPSGVRPAISMAGADPDVGLDIRVKGSGTVVIDAGGSVSPTLILNSTGGGGAAMQLNSGGGSVKTMRCFGGGAGDFEIINAAFSAVISSLKDDGSTSFGPGTGYSTGFTSGGSMNLPVGAGIKSRSTFSAWVRFDGAGNIIKGLNVNSVTRNGVGNFTVNIAAGVMADANYGFVLSVSTVAVPAASGGAIYMDATVAHSTTSFTVQTVAVNATAPAADPYTGGSVFVGFLP